MIWDQLSERARQQRLPLDTLITGVLHVIILNVLYSQEESLDLIFQGGTSLHLLHGGYRYSEDLDFAGSGMTSKKIERLMEKSKSQIEKWVVQFLGVGAFEWKSPKKIVAGRMFPWWLLYQRRGEQRKYRVKMEFTTYPVYQIRILPLQTEYQLPLPLPLVNGLDPVELLADKINAIAQRPFVKGRDFFDLWFLTEIKKTELDIELVRKKFHDYQTPAPVKRLQTRLNQCRIQHVQTEMDRFLPVRYRRQFERNQYQDVLEASQKFIQAVIQALKTFV